MKCFNFALSSNYKKRIKSIDSIEPYAKRTSEI